jgi:hypothetical protein
MAIKQSIAISGAFQGNDHIFEASENVAVTTIHLCNITSADATVNVYVLPADGSTTIPTENNKIYNSLTIPATDTYIVDTEKMILSTGDKIYVNTPDSSGQVVVTISTIGL